MADARRVLDGDNVWVEFRNSGYPFKLQRLLKEAREEGVLLDLIVPYIQSCHLPMTNGEALDHITVSDDLAEVDEQTVAQLIKEFYAFRSERMYGPLSKN